MPQEPAQPSLRREVRPADEQAVRDIVASTGFFHSYEIDVAAELVRDRLTRGPASEYRFLFLDGAAGPVAYACYGPIACTVGSFDLYWIAVHEAHRGRGLGRRLMEAVESSVAAEGGRNVYIETSSRPQYEPTRRFYEICGYRVEAVLADFYAPGDGKTIYAKPIQDANPTRTC